MLTELSRKVTLYGLLHRIDEDLAARAREGGCPHCNGVLHAASYARKPRGGPEVPEQYCIRLGLCCSSCRRRHLPPSALYFGRRVYWGVVVMVVMALRQQRPDGVSTGRLCRLFGVSRKTVVRWDHYFVEAFPASDRWRRLRDFVGVGVRDDALPGGLLEHFVQARAGAHEEGLVACLRFLAAGSQEHVL